MSEIRLHLDAMVLQLERLENDLEPRANRLPPGPMLLRARLRNIRELAKTVRREYDAERGNGQAVARQSVSA